MAERLTRPRLRPNRARGPITTDDPWVASATDAIEDAVLRIEVIEAQQLTLENAQASLAAEQVSLAAALAALIASLTDPI